MKAHQQSAVFMFLSIPSGLMINQFSIMLAIHKLLWLILLYLLTYLSLAILVPGRLSFTICMPSPNVRREFIFFKIGFVWDLTKTHQKFMLIIFKKVKIKIKYYTQPNHQI